MRYNGGTRGFGVDRRLRPHALGGIRTFPGNSSGVRMRLDNWRMPSTRHANNSLDAKGARIISGRRHKGRRAKF